MLIMKKLNYSSHCPSVGAPQHDHTSQKERSYLSPAGQGVLSDTTFKYQDNWLDGYGNISNALGVVFSHGVKTVAVTSKAKVSFKLYSVCL